MRRNGTDVGSMGCVKYRVPGVWKEAMAVASLLGQKSGKGKRKVREQEKSQETARRDFLQVRRDQPQQEVLCGLWKPREETEA